MAEPNRRSRDWADLLVMAETEVNRILDSLPAELRTEARRVPIAFARRPSRALQRDGVEPDVLGLFIGNVYSDGDAASSPLPPQINLYLENIWTVAEGQESKYGREVRKTLLHELGHYLGLDEADLESRGLE